MIILQTGCSFVIGPGVEPGGWSVTSSNWTSAPLDYKAFSKRIPKSVSSLDKNVKQKDLYQ